MGQAGATRQAAARPAQPRREAPTLGMAGGCGTETGQGSWGENEKEDGKGD